MLQESERVIQARAKSERDVRGFLKSGLADEHIRVGALLQDIFLAALEVDWQSQKVRRLPAPLPPLAISAGNLPLPERLLVKQIDQVERRRTQFDGIRSRSGGDGHRALAGTSRIESGGTFRERLSRICKPPGSRLQSEDLPKRCLRRTTWRPSPIGSRWPARPAWKSTSGRKLLTCKMTPPTGLAFTCPPSNSDLKRSRTWNQGALNEGFLRPHDIRVQRLAR